MARKKKPPADGRLARARHRVRAAWRHPGTRRLILSGAGGVALLFVALLTWALWPYWHLAGQFDEVPARQPSRLYGRSAILAAGQLVDLDEVLGLLRDEGYRPLEEGERPAAGRFEQGGGTLTIYQRNFPTPQGPGGGVALAIHLRGRRMASLELGGREVDAAYLDPPLIASYYGEDVKERRPVRVDDVPEELVEAVLAAEDRAFFHHAGLSFSGIARAMWKNVAGGEVTQGGSTITQQLVKNLYLTHERTFSRKAREAVLAVFLELRYSKRAILQAYLNEIYLGSSNGVNLIGVGAASRAFFGKDPYQLDLAEAAALAGTIRSPANYSPVAHPEASRKRRNWVLDQMVETGAIEAERAQRAQAQPVRASPEPVVRRRAPYFADFVVEEAARRFGVTDLDDGGYALLSTLDWPDQEAAVESVEWGVEALESGWEKGNDRSSGPLQAALVSVDPQGGGILAYVGGRDYSESQFDRVSQAHRQAGSAFKPVVYAAAFAFGFATPATLIEDTPLTVRLPTQTWSPENYDQQFHGVVRARTALEHSYNVATARLALQTGLDKVIELARAMGIESPLQEVPSLALGAFEVTPLDLMSVYVTLARGGMRPAIHGLEVVYDRQGRRVDGLALPEPQRAMTPETAYLVTSILQGVIDRGTAAGARSQGLQGPLAGKTGTTNGRRDNWFAGYSPERSTVVWVGYDDNARTRMSGSRAAVPVWTRFTIKVRPPGGYSAFPQPPGVTTAVIDPETGQLATDDCPTTFTEVFLEGQVPEEVCELHRYGGWWDWDRDQGGWERQPGGEERDDRPGRIRRWLDRVFGGEGEEEEQGDEGEPPPPMSP
jgi:penicillin-binding protein 1B